MQLSSILSLDCTRSAVLCSSKKRAFEIISEIAAEKLEQNAQKLFEALLTREKMGSTGIGSGIAIPHGRIQGSNQAIGIFIQCEESIEYDAIDNQPVDLIFALLVPEDLCQQHISTLAHIAERLHDKQKCRQLRHAETDQALYDLIIKEAEQTQGSINATQNS